MDMEKLEEMLSALPLYTYTLIDPTSLEFSPRIRYICSAECPMYGKSHACPPAVGTVEDCKARCLSYKNCLLIGTITECEDISDIEETLSTRGPHEELTNQVQAYFQQQGVQPYVLSTEACALCERCAYLDGKPCIHPQRMHPCLESHGINIIPVLESLGLDFHYGGNIITWYSLLFF